MSYLPQSQSSKFNNTIFEILDLVDIVLHNILHFGI